MYLAKIKQFFHKRDPFLSDKQEQKEIAQTQKKLQLTLELCKIILEILLGYNLLPTYYSILFFLLCLSSIGNIILLYKYLLCLNQWRLLHTILFQVAYIYFYKDPSICFIYLIYLSVVVEQEYLKIIGFTLFQIIYLSLNHNIVDHNIITQIISIIILVCLMLNIHLKSRNKIKQLNSPSFSIVQDQEIYDEQIFDFNDKHFIIVLKIKNNDFIYANKPCINKFGNQTQILSMLEKLQIQNQIEQEFCDGYKTTDHYFGKSTHIFENLNTQDIFHPIQAITIIEKETFKVNIFQSKWKGINSYIISLLDQTEDEQLIELKKLDQYKDSILSTVSHDLKNPIGATYQTLIFVKEDIQQVQQQNKELKIEQSKNFIEICINNLEFLQSFIKDLSDFQQIKLQKLNLNIIEFEINKFCQEISMSFYLQLQMKQIQLFTQIKIEQGIIKNDQTRIKQILFNLISNSAKFTFNGQITLIFNDNQIEIQEFYQNVKNQMIQNKSTQSLSLLEKQLKNIIIVTVQDTGVGITDEIKGQLFKSYRTFDNDKKQNRNGVGLGLMISKQICAVVGPLRYIYINSKVGSGTNFQFAIYKYHGEEIDQSINDEQPLKIHQIRQMKTPKQTPINKQRRILLVDDELFNNATNKQLIQQSGIQQIDTAYSCSEAIQFCKLKQFDLIFLDINLPDKCGLYCIRDLKKLNRSVKIYILTGHDDSELATQCLKEGAEKIIPKPLTQQQLQNIL